MSGTRDRARPARRRPSPAGPPARRRRPAWAPLRSTGATSQVPSTVIATTTSLAVVRSPPTMFAPTRAASSVMPSARSRAHCAGRSAGAASPTVSECAVPPMALTSERLAAAALRPMSRAAAHSRRKCRPSTIRSVETTTCPLGVRRTAASSPGPTNTCAPWPNRPTKAPISPNSPASASVAPAAKGRTTGTVEAVGSWRHLTRSTRVPRGAVVFRPRWSSGRLRAVQTFPFPPRESTWSSRPTS